jgi:hypothetical protein
MEIAWSTTAKRALVQPPEKVAAAVPMRFLATDVGSPAKWSQHQPHPRCDRVRT